MPGKPGSGGRVPKPQSQRRRKPRPSDNDIPTDVLPTGSVEQVDAVHRVPADYWHPIAREWFDSLADSGQAALYEPSDWAEARACAELMSRLFFADKPSAQLAQTVMTWTTNLMTTEGARRRLRLELARGPQVDEDEEASVAALDDYRKRLGASS